LSKNGEALYRHFGESVTIFFLTAGHDERFLYRFKSPVMTSNPRTKPRNGEAF